MLRQQQQFPMGRLPAYRASYLRRYHPYPRTNQPQGGEDFMTTVDHRFDEHPYVPGGSFKMATSSTTSTPTTTAESSGRLSGSDGGDASPATHDSNISIGVEDQLTIPRIEIIDVDAPQPPSPTPSPPVRPTKRARCRRLLRTVLAGTARPFAAVVRMCRGGQSIQDAEEAIEFDLMSIY
ncbi:hypothetical protein DENSPDRAFT_834885 [Dentipellis sp. KUC8613]|nr:hypothetical protein DENSPDRAFT_834885 [Dentipellis sp. KUC8613]